MSEKKKGGGRGRESEYIGKALNQKMVLQGKFSTILGEAADQAKAGQEGLAGHIKNSEIFLRALRND